MVGFNCLLMISIDLILLLEHDPGLDLIYNYCLSFYVSFIFFLLVMNRFKLRLSRIRCPLEIRQIWLVVIPL